MSVQFENAPELGSVVEMDGKNYLVVEHQGSLALQEIEVNQQNESYQYQFEDGQQQALAAQLQSQGYSVDEETMNMLMNGQLGNSEYQMADSQQTNGYSFDASEVSQNSQIIYEVKTQAVTEEDDEFKMLREMTESEEDARLATIPGAKVKPFIGFSECFKDFVEGNKQETLLHSCDPVQPNRQQYLNDSNSTTELEGDSRKDMIKNMLKNRFSDDDSDLKFHDQCWNLDRKAEGSLQSNGLPVKRRVGRPKGSVRKRDPANDDPDYDENYYDNFQPKSRPVSSHNSSGGAPRKRGRPRKNYDDDSYLDVTNSNENVLFSEPDDLGCYVIGNFVVERKHMFNKTMQNNNIYCITHNKYLQSYQPDFNDGVLYHRCDQKWIGRSSDFRSSYKVMQVEKTLNDNIVKAIAPFEDYEDMGDDELMDIFIKFAHLLVAQHFENNSISQVIETKQQDWFPCIVQIDKLISHFLENVQQMITFMPYFKDALDNFPYYKICSLKETGQHRQCSEIYSPQLKANGVIKFFGPHYDYVTLNLKDNNIQIKTDKRDPESFANDFVSYDIHESSIDSIRAYHALRHFKFSMFAEAKYEIERGNIESEDVLKSTLYENNQWIHYRLKKLKNIAHRLGLGFLTQYL